MPRNVYFFFTEVLKQYKADKTKATEDAELCNFINSLSLAGESARVFVFGSIFGGTGASSIPIIPTALRDAAKVLGANTLDLKKVKFGSTLLTQYFTFPNASDDELKKQKVIAKSELFALNCQAALQFYKDDPTVKAYYKRFYHIGWPTNDNFKIEYDGEVQTGGAQQKNQCHVVELLAAAAAYDFFYDSDSNMNDAEAQYVYRSAESTGGGYNFNGNTFFDGATGDVFANKLGMFLSLCHLILSADGMDGAWGKPGTEQFVHAIENESYRNLTQDQCKTLDCYMHDFGYEYNNDEKKLLFGWIYQIYESIGNGSFIFSSEAFAKEPDRLRKTDIGLFFSDEKHWWHKDMFGSTKPNQRTSVDKLMVEMRKESNLPNDSEQGLGTLKERFIAHLYNSLAKVQKFDVK